MMPNTICKNERESNSQAGEYTSHEKICNLDYLHNISRGNKLLLHKFIRLFLKQSYIELHALKDAIKLLNYIAVADIAHKLKSCFAMMGISSLKPVFEEMEDLGRQATGIEKIKALHSNINEIFCMAKSELAAE